MMSMRDVLEDGRKLSRRLRSHDVALDKLIGSAEDNLKRIQALKQYQGAQNKLNSVGSSKLRTQIVRDLQRENHHIRELQQENVELRAALEDHQKATELIMSKYRQHLTHYVNSSKTDIRLIHINTPGQNLQDRDEKICEMATVMNYAIVIDEENQTREHEFVSKLVTENQGLRELLEISRCNGSLKDPLIRPKMVSRPSQTDVVTFPPENGHYLEEEDDEAAGCDSDEDEPNQLCSPTDSTASSSSITSILVSPITLDNSDDEQIVYNTIKKQKKRPSLVNNNNNANSCNNNSSHKIPTSTNGGSDGNDSSSPDVEEESNEEDDDDDDDTIIVSDSNSTSNSSSGSSSNKFLENRVSLLSPATTNSDGALCQN